MHYDSSMSSPNRSSPRTLPARTGTPRSGRDTPKHIKLTSKRKTPDSPSPSKKWTIVHDTRPTTITHDSSTPKTPSRNHTISSTPASGRSPTKPKKSPYSPSRSIVCKCPDHFIVKIKLTKMIQKKSPRCLRSPLLKQGLLTPKVRDPDLHEGFQ